MFVSYRATAAWLRARHVASLASTPSLALRRLATAAAEKEKEKATETPPTRTRTSKAKADKDGAAPNSDGAKEADKEGTAAGAAETAKAKARESTNFALPPHMDPSFSVVEPSSSASSPSGAAQQAQPTQSAPADDPSAKSELIESLKTRIETLYKQLAEAKGLNKQRRQTPQQAAEKDALDEVHPEDAIKTLEGDPVAEEDLLEAATAAQANGMTRKDPEQEKAFNVFLESGALSPKDVPIQPVKAPREAKVARLAHSLTRVLFSPGVHTLRDPRTGVWNFSRDLAHVPTPEEFAFHRLPQYITASEDTELAEMAKADGIKFTGSTSTLTAALSQIYFALSGDKNVDTSHLSQDFAEKKKDFTAGAQLPASLVVRLLPNGRYAVDNNKEHAIDENVLSDYGRILEKLLTAETHDFKRFLNSAPEEAVSEAERTEREAYCYSRGRALLMRSQLDCQDNRLPGNGTFDIKTRACNPIRNDRANYKANAMYDISQLQGLTNSYEREYYDLERSGMLKFSLQARIGQMDGIFVAYHNTVRCFGFQYLPLSEIDQRLFGSTEMATQVFQVSVAILERILEQAVALYPGQSVNLSILRSKLQPWRQTKELVAVVQPTEWDPASPRPSRAMRLTIEHELDGEPYNEKVFEFSPDPEVRKNHNWVVKYKLSLTPDDHEGYATAHRHLSKHVALITAMNALYLPEGATVWQMKGLAKYKARVAAEEAEEREAAAREAREAEEAKEAEKAEASGQAAGRPRATLPDEDDTFNVTGNALTAEDLAEVEVDSAVVPPTTSAVVRWMHPNDRIMELRTAAKESGLAYKERTQSWDPDARYSYWWQSEEFSAEQGRRVMARRAKEFADRRAREHAERLKDRKLQRSKAGKPGARSKGKTHGVRKDAEPGAGDKTAAAAGPGESKSPEPSQKNQKDRRRGTTRLREFRSGVELAGPRKSWSERKQGRGGGDGNGGGDGGAGAGSGPGDASP